MPGIIAVTSITPVDTHRGLTIHGVSLATDPINGAHAAIATSPAHPNLPPDRQQLPLLLHKLVRRKVKPIIRRHQNRAG